jgi:cell shape-determining protein MreC
VLKKVLLVVLVVFLVYWLVQAPNSFANVMQDGASWVWDVASRLFESVIDVLNSLGS